MMGMHMPELLMMWSQLMLITKGAEKRNPTAKPRILKILLL